MAFMTNPYKVVEMFEEAIADYCGSKYAVAVESCTAAIFLSLMYKQSIGLSYTAGSNQIKIPKRTYPSIPCSIIHAGYKVLFSDDWWSGEYELAPLNIWDSALRFKKSMYHGGLQCLSFHIKKLLPIGRGGMILTDDEDAYKWLKKARFDGREPVPLQEDNFTMLGWNMYMQPADAARGLQLLQALGDRELPDLEVEKQGYPDLSKFKIYTQ
jgi:dTDP-4-amino-4,6-dideoxygalactose transaminase